MITIDFNLRGYRKQKKTSKYQIVVTTFILFAIQFPAFGAGVDGIPDFKSDRYNTVKDYITGDYLSPKLPGETFEWPTVSPVDWNNDGLFDLLVGYNLREPDYIRMVVFINQGSSGMPAFTGKNSPETCFYVKAIYPDETTRRIFENFGSHTPHHPHKFLVHQTAILDFDNDGLFDILLNEGMIDRKTKRGQWFLHNIGAQGKPQFKAYYLHSKHGLEDLPKGPYIDVLKMFITPPFNSGLQSFSMLDWNSDGIPDLQYTGSSTYLIIGNIANNGAWYSKHKEWLYQKPDNLESFGNQAYMATADFNSDGVNELIVASPVNRKTRFPDGFLSLFIRSEKNASEYTEINSALFTLNGEDNPYLFPDYRWPFVFAKHGWWYPRISTFDFDEDGDIDIIAGWGGGNDQKQVGDRMYLYRSTAAGKK